MSTNTELIAEARRYSAGDLYPGAQLLHEIATALEAAEAELTQRATVIARAIQEANEIIEDSDDVNHEEDNYDGGRVHAADNIRAILAAAPVSAPAEAGHALTDADLDRFEATAEPIYRSTVEAAKASKFLVATLAQWVMRLTAEVRRLGAAPVSLEAVKAETTTEWSLESRGVRMPATTSEQLARATQMPWDTLVSREVTEWRPVSTEGDNRG